MTSIALVLTVKNESDLLRANVLYHRYLGVKHVYVFLDDTTDDTRNTVADLSFVIVSDSTSGSHFLDSDERRRATAASPALQSAIEQAAGNHTARQVLNTYVAWEQARDAGIEWLISLDADELVWPGSSRVSKGQLLSEFGSLERHVEQVRLRPLEVIPRRCLYENVFREAIHFKRYGSKVRRDVYDPIAQRTRKFEFVTTRFQRMRLYRVRRFTWWYGHRRGKWAVRIGPAIAPSIHQCRRLDGKPLNTEHRFHVLHYVLYDYHDFLKKYRNIRNQPDTWVSGNRAQYRKLLWRNIVNNSSLPTNALRDYYNRWIAFDDSYIQRLARGKRADGEPDVIEVTAVRDVFEKLQGAEPRL